MIKKKDDVVLIMDNEKLVKDNKKKLAQAISGLNNPNVSDEPSYYNSNGLSPLQAYKKGLLSEEEYRGFLKGNIIKYAVRCDKKNGAEDMDKCINYCKHLRDIL